ncbi:MAG: 3-hydroxyacyl-CoA dehydrogenase NAD-binding domain-containing protein [Myxococcota bacterium]
MGFHYDKDRDGIVTVTMDMDGPVNTMNTAFTGLFETTIDRLEAEAGLTGVIFASAKKTFFAGGDLKMLVAVEPGSENEFFRGVEYTKALLRRLEALPVPTVAAINGAALGGGFELCLCCNHRIAWNDRSVKIGFPEVTLGLLPGGGGTVRLTHMLGLQAAMPYLTEGKQVRPDRARADGLIQETVEDLRDLLPRAKAWIVDNPNAVTQPWDQKGHRIPGGGSNSPKVAPMIAVGSAMLFEKTRGRLPAPERILDTMVEAARLDFDTAQRIESRNFTSLVTHPVAKNMITTFFFQLNQVNGGASRPDGVPPSSVKRLGIIGAGMMGQGIANVAAHAGIDVVLKDISLEAAQRGKAYSEKVFGKRVKRGKMTPEGMQAAMDRITPTAQLADLDGCDLIIEAVFEKVSLKDQIVKESEGCLSADGFWGSNTSTLPITRLAQSSSSPERFVGLHFFSPVDKMPLLEIVVGEKTSDETLARAFDFARQIRKTPIVVEDALGFYTSRTIGTHLTESVQLVAEGVSPARIEGLARGLLYPTSPLALNDEVSLRLGLEIFDSQVAAGLRRAEDDPTPEGTAVLRAMVEDLDRPGRYAGSGFYDYDDSGKRLWSGLSRWRKADVDLSDADIEDRLLFRPVLETLRCLEEGVLRSVADANIGSIMGIGAPVWTGGYLQFLNTYGLKKFQARCEALAERFGPRFAPPRILIAHAESGEAFR